MQNGKICEFNKLRAVAWLAWLAGQKGRWRQGHVAGQDTSSPPSDGAYKSFGPIAVDSAL